jgi:hypothetical protein
MGTLSTQITPAPRGGQRRLRPAIPERCRTAPESRIFDAGPRYEISDEQYLAEIRRTYHGRVVIWQDLDVYRCTFRAGL